MDDDAPIQIDPNDIFAWIKTHKPEVLAEATTAVVEAQRKFQAEMQKRNKEK